MAKDDLQKEVKPFLEFLKDRFRAKINPEEYCLSYSGGKDSHFLYWFIKEYLKETRIEIVGVNTSFEIPEIRDRILQNSDTVLHPCENRYKIKDVYGIPCFSKKYDDYIYRYQNGNRSDNTMNYILGKNPVMKLSKKARELLLDGDLHKISNKCCLYNKERPLKKYQRSVNKKAIIGVRASEGLQRRAAYKTCLQTSGNFTPIYDFSDELMDAIYKAYEIPIPSCYAHVTRTGCAGCPYGRNIEKELLLLPKLQRKAAVEYFKESYEVKGVKWTI